MEEITVMEIEGMLPEDWCLLYATTDEQAYRAINLTSIGVNNIIAEQALLLLFAFIPMVFVSIALACCLGKLSSKMCCVPLLSADTVVFDDDNLVNAKQFKGAMSKLRALIKAVTLSGITVSVLNTLALLSQYPSCNGYESTATTIIASWIASLFAYFVIWKIDFSYHVISKMSICRKSFWFFASKVLLLLIGSSFVRVIYLIDVSALITDTADSTNAAVTTYCYCNSDQLIVANIFLIVYISLFAVIWLLNKLRVLFLLKVVLLYIWAQWFCCASNNCCCEIKVKEPTGMVGKPCMSCCKVLGSAAGSLSMGVPMLAVIIVSITMPFICLYLRFRVISEKWNEIVKYHRHHLDVTDVVFFYIMGITFVFCIIQMVVRCKQRCSAKKQIKDEAGGEIKEETLAELSHLTTTVTSKRKRTDTKESVATMSTISIVEDDD